MRGSCHTVFHRRGCHACRQMNCLAVPAGTRNVFEKVVSLVALWMLGYSKAETAQPGMKSVQPASGSKQSHAPAEAAPGVPSTCQQACWQSVWHQAAVLEHNTGVSRTHLMLPDQGPDDAGVAAKWFAPVLAHPALLRPGRQRRPHACRASCCHCIWWAWQGQPLGLCQQLPDGTGALRQLPFNACWNPLATAGPPACSS